VAHKSTFLTFILSGLPGLGHLYLGLNKRGLQFMVSAFACIVLITFIPIVFPFVLAILWFYSLFDALQKAALINAYVAQQGKTDAKVPLNPVGEPVLSDLDHTVISLEALQGKSKLAPVWLGGLCIVIGLLVLIRQVFPGVWTVLLSAHVGSVLLAAVLIGFGIWLIRAQVKRT
jgi:hypothetical protein